ncbi:hypothetical protein T05_3168 [Trichinella murrelli]|uniref:Uncharacterized protein n=1 Tax=Trichinella murrelli TaxID=144512 RepID=A0A0V0UIU4_9BILA|nr:hypothetical protein T05_3168 [Trichinella murrelli]
MLLIIDNASCYPRCELVDRENGLFSEKIKKGLRKTVFFGTTKMTIELSLVSKCAE